MCSFIEVFSNLSNLVSLGKKLGLFQFFFVVVNTEMQNALKHLVQYLASYMYLLHGVVINLSACLQT
jgi:uncharacterized protein YhhL (DUF1145 family)